MNNGSAHHIPAEDAEALSGAVVPANRDDFADLWMIHKCPSFETNWRHYTAWLRATVDQTPTTEATIEVIRAATRMGFQTIVVPFVEPEPEHIEATLRYADRRGIRLLVDVGRETQTALGGRLTEHECQAIIEKWMRAGAWGVDFGTEDVNGGNMSFSPATLQGIQQMVHELNPNAITAMGIFGERAGFIETSGLDVIRIEVSRDLPTESELGPVLYELYGSTDPQGVIPAWEVTECNVAHPLFGLSSSGVITLWLALPGMISMNSKVAHSSPSTRHLLRVRDAHKLPAGSVAASEHRAIPSLLVNNIEILVNITKADYGLGDAKVLVSSMIELPRNADGELLLPAGEVAWVEV